MAEIVYHRAAQHELLEAIDFYESRQEGLGQRYLTAVEEAVERILWNPRMYRSLRAPYRLCRISGFPFGIIFRVDSDAIFVAAVMHFSRKPGYWLSRIKEQ